MSANIVHESAERIFESWRKPVKEKRQRDKPQPRNHDAEDSEIVVVKQTIERRPKRTFRNRWDKYTRDRKAEQRDRDAVNHAAHRLSSRRRTVRPPSLQLREIKPDECRRKEDQLPFHPANITDVSEDICRDTEQRRHPPQPASQQPNKSDR